MDLFITFLIWLAFAVIFGAIGRRIAAQANRDLDAMMDTDEAAGPRYSDVLGAALGALLGPVGLLVMAMYVTQRMPDGTPKTVAFTAEQARRIARR